MELGNTTMDGVLFTENDNRTGESAEQDQTTRMGRMVLLYTLHKINLWSPTATEWLISFEIK